MHQLEGPHRSQTQADGRGLVAGRAHEVGQAGDDADVGLLTHTTKTFSEDLELLTGDLLRRRHDGPVSAVDRVQVPLHVGVAKDGEDLRHLDQVSVADK